jgi:hypothetical protein
VVVWVNNSANVTNSSIRIGFTVDSIAPVVSIQIPQNTTYNYNTSLWINFTATDNLAIDQCRYSIDGAASILLTNCQNTTFNVSEGWHRIYLIVNDTINNTNTSNVNFTINTLISAVTINSPTNLTYNVTTVNLNYTVGPDHDQCRYELDYTNNSLTTCQNTSLSNLAQGWHTVVVWVNNSANVTNSSTRIGFTIDNIGPVITMTQPTNTTYASTNVSFSISANEALTWCKYEFNNVNTSLPATACGGNSATGSGTFIALAGLNNFTIWANDSGGNWTAATRINFTVKYNITQPTLNSPTNTTYNTTTINLNYTVSNDHDQCRYELDYTNNSLTTCQNTSLSSLAQGWHTVVVWVNNSANVTNSSARIGFTVDSIAPVVSIQIPQNTTYN